MSHVRRISFALSFYPNTHTANTFTFKRHLFFAIISEYVLSQIQSICKYCVSSISESRQKSLQMNFDKTKKKKI